MDLLSAATGTLPKCSTVIVDAHDTCCSDVIAATLLGGPGRVHLAAVGGTNTMVAAAFGACLRCEEDIRQIANEGRTRAIAEQVDDEQQDRRWEGRIVVTQWRANSDSQAEMCRKQAATAEYDSIREHVTKRSAQRNRRDVWDFGLVQGGQIDP